MEMNEFVSSEVTPRQLSIICFKLMDRFKWTYDEVMNLPIPVFYSLLEFTRN